MKHTKNDGETEKAYAELKPYLKDNPSKCICVDSWCQFS